MHTVSSGLLPPSSHSLQYTAALPLKKWCFGSCELTLNYVDFNDTGPGPRTFRWCQSTLRSTSLYLCVDEYCEETGRTDWLHGLNETCQRTSNATLPPYEIVAEYPPKDRLDIRRLGAEEALKYAVLAEPVIPERSFLERAFTTLDAAYFEVNVHRLYGWCMYYFWAIVFCLGTGYRLLSFMSGIRRQRWQQAAPSAREFDETERSDCRRSRPFGWASAQLKRFATIPAAFNNRCAQPLGWCTIPPRIQSFTILAFVLLNVALCTVNYRITRGNLYWPKEHIQLTRYVSDRTGVISLANFPLIWLFGTRNNALIWLTGWSFGTYNNFHRWVARVATVQAVAHSIGYTLMVYDRGYWLLLAKYLHKHYFWNGELSTVFMCAILAFSVYGIRRTHYESFLTLHVVFSIIILVAMYYHVEIFTSGEYNVFIFLCLAIWLIDRLLRLARILAFSPSFWNTTATATYDPSSNIIRVEVAHGQSVLKQQPGTHYYMYVLDNPLYAHQNHPFTAAYQTPSNKGPVRLAAHDPRHHRSSQRQTDADLSTESDLLLPHGTAPEVQSLIFLVRPYDGFTCRLKSRALHAPATLRVLIEGPYGHTEPLHHFSNVLFIVGGTGIAVPLSHLSRIVSSGSATASVRIIWAVREEAFLGYVVRELRGLLQDKRIVLEAYITQDEAGKDDALSERPGAPRVYMGRPDVCAVMEEAATAVEREQLAVVACGPAQMADEARQACVRMLGRGYHGIEYFEESFKW